ncbi:MAG: hypothetical protein ACSLFI_10630 [Solirubrobacterales bacterium]
MRVKLGVLVIVVAGVLIGCGGSDDSDDGGLATVDGQLTAEAIKDCLDEKAPKPMKIEDPEFTPRVVGDISDGGTLASFVQVSVYENTKQPARQVAYEKDLYKGMEGAPVAKVANAENVLLSYQQDISKADLALLNSCTTPE